MQNRLRIGIVGCGVALHLHSPAILAFGEGAHIVGLCDLDPARLAQAGDELGVSGRFTDLSEMIEKARPDVIHILTPPKTHLPIALEAIEHGCHLLLEKPMAMTVAESDQIIDAARAKQVKLCLMHNHMLDPQFLQAKSYIENGGIGDILNVDGKFFIDREKMLEEGNDQSDHWIHDLPLGIFSEHATPHMLYLVLDFLTSVQSVRTVKKTSHLATTSQSFNNLEILLDAGQTSGHISLWDNMAYPNFFIRVFGTKGVVHLNMYDLTWSVEKHRARQKTLAAMLATLDMAAQSTVRTGLNTTKILFGRLKRRPGHRRLIADFYNSILQGGEPPVTGAEGREVVRILEMIEQDVAARKD